jgi:type II secretory pathway pseudopilin PulG
MYRKTRGFSVLEFVIAVALLSGIVLFAAPRYLQFRARAVQSDARIHLINIDKLQRDFRFKFDKFSLDLKELGFEPEPTSRYSYRIVSATADGYVAEAEAPEGVIAKCAGKDVWSMNQEKAFKNTENGSVGCSDLRRSFKKTQ